MFIDDQRDHFSSVQSLDRMGRPRGGGGDGGHDRRFGGHFPPVFSVGGHCEQFWHGQECPLFEFVHPAFPPPTTSSSTFQGALKDGCGELVGILIPVNRKKGLHQGYCFGEVVVGCDISFGQMGQSTLI